MASLDIIFKKILDIITLITILLKKPKYINDCIFNVSKYVLQLYKAFILTKIGITSKEIIILLKNTH